MEKIILHPDVATAILTRFHDVVRERARLLLAKHPVDLPALPDVFDEKLYFAVPGMYGGFSYWLEHCGATPKLIVQSWSRVVEGSEQRHEITVEQTVQVAS